MLSRVADSIYWMSRYVERASNIARFLEVSYHLNLDLQFGGQEQWAPLVEITGDMKTFMARYGEATSENVMHFLMFNPEYPNSIANCLRAARDNAMGLRETMPLDMFEQINAMGKMVPQASREKAYFHSRVFTLCRQIKREGMLLSGIVSETIERGRGYHFWRLGEFLERADKTSRLLHVKYFYLLPQMRNVGSPIDVVQWSALLLSLDAREAYYRTHGLIEPNKVIEMIVLDKAFPRAIRFCLQSALDSLNRITRDVPGEPHRLLQNLCEKLEGLTAQEIVNIGLNEFIDDLQLSINAVNDSIYTHFNTAPLQPTGA